MKTKMNRNLTKYQRLFARYAVGVLVMLTASWAAMAQQTVFFDTFANSTINGWPDHQHDSRRHAHGQFYQL